VAGGDGAGDPIPFVGEHLDWNGLARLDGAGVERDCRGTRTR
jgi:hypothetical protein